eukprot:CAMPEP_0197945676 /NCGR_PEP_ID=MMETSP1439-20131203/126029_1 /TAXON_ID=66791 /ORGANISM="Gonyaulax spinifera, Strain CCMP409" /LENGTH=129 /DNA_ID=CAMNT_0043568931 /DNA_START=73 /DNA_END=462 /DNA_ORIENTATION=+
MGQGPACNCEGHKDNEVTGFSPRAGGANDVVMAAMPQEKAGSGKAALPPQLDRLKGYWRTDGDTQMMGEIVDGVILWDEAFNHPQTPLRISPSGQIEMELMNTMHQASYHDGPPACLRWSDGETWVRVK